MLLLLVEDVFLETFTQHFNDSRSVTVCVIIKEKPRLSRGPGAGPQNHFRQIILK